MLVRRDGSSESAESLETAGRQRAGQLTHAVMLTVLVFAITTPATRLAVKLPPADPHLSAVLHIVVWSGTFEAAELKANQIRSYGADPAARQASMAASSVRAASIQPATGSRRGRKLRMVSSA